MQMKRFKVNKIMRDKTAQWMESKGIKYSVTHATPESMLNHLCLKLEEEAEELCELSNNRYEMTREEAEHAIVDEMADILEVMMSMANRLGISWRDVEEYREDKAREQGSFMEGVHVNWVEISRDNPEIRHFEHNREHPEIHTREEHFSHRHEHGEHRELRRRDEELRRRDDDHAEMRRRMRRVDEDHAEMRRRDEEMRRRDEEMRRTDELHGERHSRPVVFSNRRRIVR